jgi:hypothetical protein
MIGMTVEFNITKDLIIRTSDRISIFGRTGSGKTFFVKNWLLPHYTHYVFWDVKHENIDIEYEVIVNTPAQLKNALTVYRKILYQPSTSTHDDFNKICEIIFNNKNTVLYVDEASKISTPMKIAYWHNVILTQGRTYNVGIINSAQRPRFIHNSIIAESEHLFIFSLNLETDIIKIKQQIGDAGDDIRILPEHHVLYNNVKYNKSYIFKPANLFDPVKKEIKPLEIYRPKLEEYMAVISHHRERPTIIVTEGD